MKVKVEVTLSHDGIKNIEDFREWVHARLMLTVPEEKTVVITKVDEE